MAHKHATRRIKKKLPCRTTVWLPWYIIVIMIMIYTKTYAIGKEVNLN